MTEDCGNSLEGGVGAGEEVNADAAGADRSAPTMVPVIARTTIELRTMGRIPIPFRTFPGARMRSRSRRIPIRVMPRSGELTGEFSVHEGSQHAGFGECTEKMDASKASPHRLA